MGGEILDRRRGARDEDGIFQARVLEWIAISMLGSGWHQSSAAAGRADMGSRSLQIPHPAAGSSGIITALAAFWPG